MKNWIAEGILNLGEWLLKKGNDLRELEYNNFCDANPDCLCDDPFCIEMRTEMF
jgi:hypothetical protein